MDINLKHKIKNSLGASYKEGIAASLMSAAMDYYLIPFGLFLGATAQEIGFLIAIPNLLSSFSQFFCVQGVKTFGGSRLKLIVTGIMIQAILLIPVASLVFPHISSRVEILILFVSFFRFLGNLIGPAWGSLMSDYLSEKDRGNYFGHRSRAVGISGVIGIGFWGLFLFLVKRVSAAWAFFGLFLGAAFFRFLSCYYMKQMTDLPARHVPEHDFTFWMFVIRLRESNFVKFVFYVAVLTFSMQLAGPYFSVYMLRDLKFNYLTYMSIHLSLVVASLFSFPIWGRHADLVGNARILKITGFLIPVSTVFWPFTKNPVCLMAIEALSGFALGGFALCSTNFIYDAVSPEKRVRCIGYFNLITGMAIFMGASFGGFLSDKLPPFHGSSILSLFRISAVLRSASNFFLAGHFQEVRQSTKKISSADLLFSVVGVRPILGANTETDILADVHHGSRKG